MIGKRTDAIDPALGQTGSISASRRHPLADLYGVGPLRLRDRSLKTVHAYVSRSRLGHNAQQLRGLIGPDVRLCAMVKANGYGLGARNVVSALNRVADWFAVANLEEAETIHPFAGGHPILATCPIFAGIEPELVRLARARGIHCTVCSREALDYVHRILDVSEPRLNLQVKIDSGMGRLGCGPQEAPELVERIHESSVARLSGVYSHFASADDPDPGFALGQLATFNDVLAALGLDGSGGVVRHVANSSGALRFAQARLDMVRVGIALYGYTNLDDSQMEGLDLRPVVRVEAPVVQVKTLESGQSAGYDRAWTAQERTCVGVVPVGYADGFCRALSNRAVMRYDKHFLPVLGRVSMDLTIVDLSQVPEPHEGMIVTVLDDERGSPANAAGHARLASTLPYEVLTTIGKRVKRVLTD